MDSLAKYTSRNVRKFAGSDILWKQTRLRSLRLPRCCQNGDTREVCCCQNGDTRSMLLPNGDTRICIAGPGRVPLPATRTWQCADESRALRKAQGRQSPRSANRGLHALLRRHPGRESALGNPFGRNWFGGERSSSLL